MSAFRWLQSRKHICLIVVLCQFLLAAVVDLRAQDLSWVNGAIERSKNAQRETLPAWQYDPRVALSNSDASLNALAVVNPDRLFAVGDRGLILSSTDGGRSWQAQNSLTSLNLYGVAFFDEQRGIAVGGTVQPLSQSSLGIVLVTIDGGKSWQSITSSLKASLPRLTGVSLVQRTVRVWGDYSSAHGSGIFESHDQGRSWQPVAAPLNHLQAVATQQHGMTLGLDRAGRLAQIPQQANRELIQLAPPTAPIQALIHTGSQWVAVGDCGTVRSSLDGEVWMDHPMPLPAPAQAVCDFRCATASDQNIWIAGTPGSILLNSPDAGRSWRVVPVDQSWSISAIQFVDRNRGWFVTVGGSIWATRDGGATWFSQRVPVKRLGLQAVAASANNISWPALAHSAWQAKQATDLITAFRENPEDVVDFLPDAPATLSTLGTQVGLVAGWHPAHWPVVGKQVQLPSMSISSGPQEPNFAHYLAMRLRAGRPTVLLIDDLDGAAANHESLAESVAQAMHLAEHDQPAVNWLKNDLHLAPWKPTKLMNVTVANGANFTISSEELLRDSGLAMQDVLAPVFGKQSLTTPNSCLHCLQLSSGNSASRQNLFANQERSPESTRIAELSKIGNLQLVMGRAHRDKAWQALAPNSLNVDEELNVWTRKLDAVIQQTPKHECGTALLLLADRCLTANQWERWSVAVDRVSNQPAHCDSTRYGSLLTLRMAACEEFLAWQSQSSGSGNGESPAASESSELAQARATKRLRNPQESDPFESLSGVTRAVAIGTNQPAVQTASAEVAVAALSPVDAMRTSALKRVVGEFNRLSDTDRALVARPDIQLAHYARRRALAEMTGEPMPDAGLLQAMTAQSWLAGWPQVASQEFVMAGGRSERTAWSAHASRAQEAPTLNGLADDACWQAIASIELSNPFAPAAVPALGDRSASQAKFAYDDEFLYVVVTCPNVQGATATSTNAKGPRRYDMNLDGTDRIVLNLDTDRDYSSSCELAVNRAGHTYDRCCQYSQWNPIWKVAVHESDTSWSAEFAIRLSDLTTRRPIAGSAWSISAFRFVPNWGVQSWSQLRSSTPRPQGNGLLVFD